MTTRRTFLKHSLVFAAAASAFGPAFGQPGRTIKFVIRLQDTY
ncbi:twin-arginine translocation signal domain-containing protein [Bradyrhizobium sp. 190]|nr:twin-arginine translocation signal domain-containing protein [Bradyrhizobium sp. 190]